MILIALPACGKKAEPVITIPKPQNSSVEHLKIGIELRAVSISEMQEGTGNPGGAHFLQTDSDGRLTRMRTLEPLEHLVRIKDKGSALDTVRLRTLPALAESWPPHPFEFEVLSQKEVKTLPSYGVDSYEKFDSALSSNSNPSGSYGVLSPAAYIEGKFTPPVVKENADGFVITRWIITEDVSGQLKVQKIQEDLASTGKYKRTILKNLAAPKLAGTTWGLPAKK